MGINEYTIDYQYNDQGYRTNQTITYDNGSKSIDYELVDDRVIYESGKEFDEDNLEINAYDIIYTYDYDGTLISFNYKDDTHASAEYFYLRNQQGDITHIINSSGTTIIKYKYDAYGNIIDEYVRPGYQHIFDHNSYTYRGYRYDSNTELYYLNSRYYNPEVGRFINADGLLGNQGNILGHNMYAYGENNVINGSDLSGYKWNWGKIFQTAAIAVTSAVIIAATVTMVAPVNPIAAAGIIGGVSGASGQMISNTWNDEPLLNNVAGAAVGGVMIGLTGSAPASGFVNALINQGENIIRNGEFNLNQLTAETMVYSITNWLPGSKLIGSGSQLIETGVYTMTTNSLSFTGLDCYLQNRQKTLLPEFVINISYRKLSMTRDGVEVGDFQFD